MKFEDVKPGMIFKIDAEKNINDRYWIVYSVKGDVIYTYHYRSKFINNGIFIIKINKERWYDKDYPWAEDEMHSLNKIGEIGRDFIKELFEYGIS